MKFELSDYIAIHSEDVDEASHYYEKVFGLKVKRKGDGVNFIDAALARSTAPL